MKTLTGLIKKIGVGYLQLIRRLLIILCFLFLLGFFNYLIVFPLRNLAVNQRMLYNILALAGISLLLGINLVRSIIRVGLNRSLISLGVLVLFSLQVIIPRSLSLIGVLLACLSLLGIHILIRKNLLGGGRTILFLILSFFNGFYRISLAIGEGQFWLVIPASLYFLAFLGIIMYENLHFYEKVDI